jgi:hypothetical protein
MTGAAAASQLLGMPALLPAAAAMQSVLLAVLDVRLHAGDALTMMCTGTAV